MECADAGFEEATGIHCGSREGGAVSELKSTAVDGDGAAEFGPSKIGKVYTAGATDAAAGQIDSPDVIIDNASQGSRAGAGAAERERSAGGAGLRRKIIFNIPGRVDLRIDAGAVVARAAGDLVGFGVEG